MKNIIIIALFVLLPFALFSAEAKYVNLVQTEKTYEAARDNASGKEPVEVWEYYYDGSGNKVKEVATSNGLETGTWIHHYNTAGRETGFELYPAGSERPAVWKYTYDAAGHKQKGEITNPDGIKAGSEKYECDSQGREIKIYFYDKAGNLDEMWTNKYDSKGFKTRSDISGPDKKIKSFTLFFYDAKGYCTKVEYHNADGTMDKVSSMSYKPGKE